jgi:hypothetical protein
LAACGAVVPKEVIPLQLRRKESHAELLGLHIHIHKLKSSVVCLTSPEFIGAFIASERERVLAFHLHGNYKCQQLVFPEQGPTPPRIATGQVL